MLKIFQMVSDDNQLSPDLQYAAQLVDECDLNRSAAVMPAFRPGVGEKDMDPPDAFIGDAPWNNISGVGVQHAYVCQT